MWRPLTTADVEAILGVPETAQLEFKRELVRDTVEVAKDIASMTVDGGVLAYGIEETGLVASALSPIPLQGTRERIRQIADSQIQPPPGLEITILETSEGSGEGFAIVAVPASPLAPHMVNDRFPARSGTTTRWLSELEVARLYEQRRALAQVAAGREPLAGYLPHEDSTGDVRGSTAILRMMVAPAGAYRHPRGVRVRDPLGKATGEAAVIHRNLIANPHSRLIETVTNRWEPQSTSGFKAGTTFKAWPKEGNHEMKVAAAATYAHSGPFSFEIAVGLSRSEGPRFAHEHLWVSLAFLSPMWWRSMGEWRTCAEFGCSRQFRPKSSRNRYCLEHRKTKPRDPAHSVRYGRRTGGCELRGRRGFGGVA